jgi:hypothetical protein
MTGNDALRIGARIAFDRPTRDLGILGIRPFRGPTLSYVDPS